VIKKINKLWKSLLEELPYFSGYSLSKSRELSLETDLCKIILEAQPSKWWEKDGGEIAVNILIGLKWKDESLNTYVGMNFQSYRLSRDCIDDQWWEIYSDDDVERFKSELITLLNSCGIPLIQQCSTYEGTYVWMLEHDIPGTAMKQSLELYGLEGLKSYVINWLQSFPRRAEDTFAWIENTGCFQKGEMEAMKKKSWQAKDIYEAYIKEWTAQHV
jgi:hypothetical protein